MATARQFQTPVSWGMGVLNASSRVPIGGFGHPKELSRVIIGDSTVDPDPKKILLVDVAADKMTGILFYPAAWTVTLSAINSVTGVEIGDDFLSANFTGKASGKFGRFSDVGSSTSIWSTNKQPPEVLTKDRVFDLASGGASVHAGSLYRFYQASIIRFGSFYDDVVDQVITCDDDSGVESGRAIYSNRGACTSSNGDTFTDAGRISASIDKIYYKPNGKCDVLITFETYLYGGSRSWFAYGSTAWGGGALSRPLTGETFTATILGKPVTLYVYSTATTGTLSFDVNFDVVQTEAWDFSTP